MAEERLEGDTERTAQGRLRRERDFISALLSTADVLVVVTDREGRIVRFNTACERTTGYSFEEVSGKRVWDLLLTPEQIEGVKTVFAELRAGQFPNEHENYWVAKDESRRLIRWSNTALLDDSGSVEYLIGTGVDVTDLKKTKEALLESEAKWQSITEDSPDYLMVLNRDAGIEYINRLAPGMTREQVLGMSVYDYVPAQSGAAMKECIDRVLETGAPNRYEVDYHDSDGLLHHFEGYVRLMEPPDPEALLVVRTRDVTARKQTEESLKWELKVTSALAELANALVGPPRSIDEIAELVLSSAKSLTQSDHGYVSSIDPETGDNVGHTLTRMMAACRVSQDDRRITFPKGEDGTYSGLWGQSLNTREGFYTNSPQACESSKGTPEGHIPIRAFLSVPATVGDRLLGQIALANPRNMYCNRDLSAIKRLGDLYALALQRHWAGQELARHQSHLEDLVEERAAEVVVANRRLKQEVEIRRKAESDLRQALSEVARLKDRLQAENVYLREEIKSSHGFKEIVGESEALKNVLLKVEQVTSTNATVLILGETGTGKELIARAIQGRSPRKELPFVRVNCSSLPPSLIENELFGHERGAFTGALAKKIGRFELANGGTVFLDEVGDLPLDLQAKLLRVLQEGEFERIGSNKTLKVDVRVLAATNRNLDEAVAEGRFRSDLFYRLNVFPIVVPPLRDRLEDIPLLVSHIVKSKQAALGKIMEGIPQEVIDTLQSYDWPGNVRELENVIEHSIILSPGPVLELCEAFGPSHYARSKESCPQCLEAVERAHILKVVKGCGWRIRGKGNAAELLGINPSTLRSRMKKLGIARTHK